MCVALSLRSCSFLPPPPLWVVCYATPPSVFVSFPVPISLPPRRTLNGHPSTSTTDTLHLSPPLSNPNPPPPRPQLKQAKEGKLRRLRRKRQVDHEQWRAVNHLEAEKLLREQGRVGEFVFRPSGSGGGLSLSWLFLEDTVIHIPIKEEEKGAGDAVGKKLIIGGKTYQVGGWVGG